MDEITIDRLILDIPGLTPEEARDVTERVGTGLAAAADRAENTGFSSTFGGTNFDALSIDLNSRSLSADRPRLADAIVTALLKQMGRS